MSFKICKKSEYNPKYSTSKISEKFKNDSFSQGNLDRAMDETQLEELGIREALHVDKGFLNSELVDYFSSSSNIIQNTKSSSQRILPPKKKTQKLKCFGSNPILTATVSNLSATTTSSTNFLDVQIPQISLLESIPTKYRRGRF